MNKHETKRKQQCTRVRHGQLHQNEYRATNFQASMCAQACAMTTVNNGDVHKYGVAKRRRSSQDKFFLRASIATHPKHFRVPPVDALKAVYTSCRSNYVDISIKSRHCCCWPQPQLWHQQHWWHEHQERRAAVVAGTMQAAWRPGNAAGVGKVWGTRIQITVAPPRGLCSPQRAG